VGIIVRKKIGTLNEERGGSKEASVKEIFRDGSISFTFPNLKNLAESDITYSQFLACVAQRLLLKQYAAQTIDLDNFICPMSRSSEVFNEIKGDFNVGIKNLFLKRSTIETINLQSSKNKVTEKEQQNAAKQFVTWYDKFWFERLKSQEMLESLEEVFRNPGIPEMKSGSDDWQTLRNIFSSTGYGAFFNMTQAEKETFVNKAEDIPVDWLDGILNSVNKFIELSGETNLKDFESVCNKGNLIAPTFSSFVISTLYGIEEVEKRKKKYTAPLDPYNMFHTFNDTSMSPLLKMNQLVFTTYNYFKILL